MTRRRHRTPLAVPIAVPRAVTPADEVLRRAVDEIRRQDPEWAVAKQVADALADVGDRIASLEDAREALEHTRRRLIGWVLGSIGGAVSALGVALWFAFGVAGDAGESRGRAAEREVRAAEERALLHRLRDSHEDLARELAELRGRVRWPSPAPTPYAPEPAPSLRRPVP